MRSSTPELGRDLHGIEQSYTRNQIQLGRLKPARLDPWHVVDRDGMTTMHPSWNHGNFRSGTDVMPWSVEFRDATDFSGAAPLSYFRNPDGFVHMRGMLTTGWAGDSASDWSDTVFYLPGSTPRRRGWRPQQNEVIHLLARQFTPEEQLNGNHLQCRIDAETGEVKLEMFQYATLINDWQWVSASISSGSRLVNATSGSPFDADDLYKYATSWAVLMGDGSYWRPTIDQVNSGSQVRVSYASPSTATVNFGFGTYYPPPAEGNLAGIPVWSFPSPGGWDTIVFDGVSFQAAL